METVQETLKRRGFAVAVTGLLLLALALRVIGAQGDLWQDEIYSVSLVSKLTRLDQIFWKVHVDNNHPLNSVWLYLIGPFAPNMLIRAFSIVVGTTGVALAGAWGYRDSRGSALIAMSFFACSYFMVNYGSEARGYAGFVSCLLLAMLLVEDDLTGKRHPVFLPAVLLTGVLFHIYMIFGIVSLAVAHFWIVWRGERNLPVAMGRTVGAFRWSGVLIGVYLAVQLLPGYSIGGVFLFDWTSYIFAYGGAVQTAAAVPFDIPDWMYMTSVAVVSAWAFARDPDNFRSAVFASFIIVVPLALALVRMPDMVFPRHLTIVVIGTLLLAARLLDKGLKSGSGQRIVCTIVIAVLCLGNGIQLVKFFRNERGHFTEAVLLMTKDGPATYAVNMSKSAPFVEWFADKADRRVTKVTAANWCGHEPDWVISEKWGTDPDWLINRTGKEPPKTLTPPDEIMVGPSGCQMAYDMPVVYPAWGLSARTWTVFHRK